MRVVKHELFLKEIFHVNGSIFSALQSKDIIANKKEKISVFMVVFIYVFNYLSTIILNVHLSDPPKTVSIISTLKTILGNSSCMTYKILCLEHSQ